MNGPLIDREARKKRKRFILYACSKGRQSRKSKTYFRRIQYAPVLIFQPTTFFTLSLGLESSLSEVPCDQAAIRMISY